MLIYTMRLCIELEIATDANKNLTLQNSLLFANDIMEEQIPDVTVKTIEREDEKSIYYNGVWMTYDEYMKGMDYYNRYWRD